MPIFPKFTYLNWAGLAPLRPKSYLQSLFTPELFGNVLLPRWQKETDALRESVAEWLGCDPTQVAFLPSTTVALTLIANSLNWQPGDVVLYPQRDFPANVMPWEKLRRFDVSPMPIQDWYSPWPERTRMVALSTVDYSTGIEQPWEAVVRHAQQHGIWTCIDAVQSAGIKPSWSPEIDFWCTGTQKWFASGLGLAILVLSKRALTELSSPFPSWLGLKDPPYIESGFDHVGQSWEFGWVTPTAMARFHVNLKTFRRIGWETVSQKVKQRRDYLHEQLLEIGWPVVSCAKNWSGIVSFDPGPGVAEKIVKNGYRHQIITARRGDYVRLSPHMFNTMKQLKTVSHWLWKCKLQYGSEVGKK